jgi:peptide-methionine (S)-S-oxide reductase
VSRASFPAAALLLGFVACLTLPAMSADTNSPAPPRTELATFGGGCFWCVEAMFETLPGVRAVISGYAGGKTADPTYKQVCSGTTGHAEVVQVEFDPAQIAYEKLLAAFWDAHDPTTPNRQGNDVGTQYRSIILYHSEAQRMAAEKSKQAAGWKFPRPIVTDIGPVTRFYKAEEDHQDFFRKNPNQAYCAMVVRPKLEKFKKIYSDR